MSLGKVLFDKLHLQRCVCVCERSVKYIDIYILTCLVQQLRRLYEHPGCLLVTQQICSSKEEPYILFVLRSLLKLIGTRQRCAGVGRKSEKRGAGEVKGRGGGRK